MKKLLSDVMIELHVPDFKKAKKFYSDLGFKVVWERNSENPTAGYLVMRNNTSVINFYCGSKDVYNHLYFKNFPKTTPRGYAVEIIIPVEKIENFYKSFCLKYKQYVVKSLSHIHSHSDFRIIDPFGFYLRFVEKYNWVDGRDKYGNTLLDI